MNQIGELLELVGGVKRVAADLQEAHAEYPAAFSVQALLSACVRAIVQHALSKGAPQGLRDDLSTLFGTQFTDEQTQKIREFVLKREIAREGE